MSRHRWAVLTGALGLLACASPDPSYYTLAAVPGASRTNGPKTVEVRRIGLAGYLDRPDIVRTGEDYRLSIARNERWGEPLDQLIGRILAEDLTNRLSGSTVFTEGTISAASQAIVEVDVQRFDADRQGAVTLLAQIAVRPAGAGPTATTRTLRLGAPAASGSSSDVAASMSGLLGQAADVIAAMLAPD